MNESFCSLPWTSIDINAQGELKPCCKYKNSIATDIKSYFSSPELQEIKDSFLAGTKPAGCRRCWVDEELGIKSKRQLDLKYVFNDQHPSLDTLKIISMPFGNTCNFACRICGSQYSSFWRSHTQKLQKEFPDIRIYKHNKFYKDKNFTNQILSLSKDVLLFEFPGGEPFLTGVEEHLNFLNSLLKYNPQNLKLHYITNTSIFPESRFWDLWKNFKNVDIQLSIDGTGSQFEYNRWPGKWSECYQNIKNYQVYTQKYSNLQLSISHTVSIFTVYYLPEFIHWCLKEKLPKPYLGLLLEPDYYSVSALPEKIRKTIAKRPEFQIQELKPIKKELELTSPNNLENTIKYIKILDKHRKQNFAETFPEMIDIGFPYE
jgi:MoaA/NifB/PqqE/SkfB family radical SAM enzyme